MRTMVDQKNLEAIFKRYGFEHYKWINPKEIVVSHWVRMKCMFGCPDFGKNASCPPHVPSVDECRAFFQEYDNGVIFHIAKQVEKPEDRHVWSREINETFLRLEREVFLSGCFKVFLLNIDSCAVCKDCGSSRAQCVNPGKSRPTAEALGVDVYTTVIQNGFPVHVLSDYSQTMNRYAFLLVD